MKKQIFLILILGLITFVGFTNCSINNTKNSAKKNKTLRLVKISGRVDGTLVRNEFDYVYTPRGFATGTSVNGSNIKFAVDSVIHEDTYFNSTSIYKIGESGLVTEKTYKRPTLSIEDRYSYIRKYDELKRMISLRQKRISSIDDSPMADPYDEYIYEGASNKITEVKEYTMISETEKILYQTITITYDERNRILSIKYMLNGETEYDQTDNYVYNESPVSVIITTEFKESEGYQDYIKVYSFEEASVCQPSPVKGWDGAEGLCRPDLL